MKNSTKFKIIRFVEKLLKYQQPELLPLKKEVRQIREIKWTDSFDVDREIEKIQLDHIISHAIAFEMEKCGIIQIRQEIDRYMNKRIIYARVFFIDPPDDWQNKT